MSEDEYGNPDVRGAGGERDKRPPRFSWTPAYEATFFRSLCESVQLGLRENHSFKAEAWDRAATALRDQHRAYPTKSHLVNKSDNARKKFRLWRGLREHPDFLYNPVTRAVSGSDEAWKAHIEKEPLSRALRGRPFEHEEFMEILYPDVVGSGGAPKRIMKPKRKGPDAIPGVDEADMPGTAILNLAGVDQSGYPQHAPATHPRPPVPQPNIRQMAQSRPMSTAIPPRTNLNNTSALTPPEETASQNRNKRPSMNSAAAAPAKTNPAPTPSANTNTSTSAHANKRRRISTQPLAAPLPGEASAGSIGSVLEDGLLGLADALKAKAPPRWNEQACDIFFSEFADEDMDLQLKIVEKVLVADENKAMIFCKMPSNLRKHWVRRLREMHNRQPVVV